MLFNSVINNSH